MAENHRKEITNDNMNKRPYATIMLLVMGLTLTIVSEIKAQRHEIFNERIRSLQVMVNNKWMTLPVMDLNGGVLSVSFDDLTHEYHRYIYKVEHCEADWSLSKELFESDYIEGFASGNTIDNIRESLLTNTLYTNYRLRIPNEKCRIKMSGNYKLSIFDENQDDEPILTVCFMVLEPLMGLALSVSANTDIDINNTHQQVSMALNYSGINITNPQQQIKTVVMQNKRWDDARWNLEPQYIMYDGLKWEHNRSLIFEAGNEYRKFEMLSTNVASMGIETLDWDGNNFHAYPFIAEPRPNYLYDEDADGAYLFRNSDNTEAAYTSDYINVHFRLTAPQPYSQDIYLNADWTFDRFLPQYRMQYDEEKKMYEAVIPLKLGYYNYQFLSVNQQGKASFLPSEGNFYQTENQYQALVYYREQGGRTDRLVAYQQVSTR